MQEVRAHDIAFQFSRPNNQCACVMQLTQKGATDHEAAANVANSGKAWDGLAGASRSSLREVLGDKLSLLLRDGQPL